MKYFGAVVAALCQTFIDSIKDSYRNTSKQLLTIRLTFVLLTTIVSTLVIRQIIRTSDDDVETFGDAFRIVFGALSIVLSISTVIILSDFSYLTKYIESHAKLNLCSRFFAAPAETAD